MTETIVSHINTTASRFWSVVNTFAQEPPEAPEAPEAPPYPAWLQQAASLSLAFSSSSDSRCLTSSTAILLMLCVKSGIGNGVLAAELTGRNSSFCFTENADYLFVGKTLLHGNHIRRQGQYKGITSIGMY